MSLAAHRIGDGVGNCRCGRTSRLVRLDLGGCARFGLSRKGRGGAKILTFSLYGMAGVRTRWIDLEPVIHEEACGFLGRFDSSTVDLRPTRGPCPPVKGADAALTIHSS